MPVSKRTRERVFERDVTTVRGPQTTRKETTMNNRNHAVSLVLTDANFMLLIALVRREVRIAASNADLDDFAELFTDMSKQWHEQVIGRVGEQSDS